MDAAYKRFNDLQDILENLRKVDEENDKAFQKYALEIVRAKHEIPDDKTSFDAPKSSKKKAAPPVVDPTARKIKKRRKE